MAGSHMKVLAAQIYNEQNIVTYRLLSRLLGVHVNIAKQMLQEFYLQAKQDGKPCHATYILSGFIEEAVSASTSDAMQLDGEEFVISSLPVATQESSTSGTPPSKLVRTVVLANEDDVQEARNRFSELTSIHVYSLAPAVDPVLLTTCSYDVFKKYDVNMSPTEIAEKYGAIANPNAVKRELKKYVAPTVQVGTAGSKTKAPITQTKAEPQKPSGPETKANIQQTSTETVKSATPIKRTTAGGIMNAFANAPPRKPKPKPEEPPAQPSLPKPEPKVSAKRQQELDELNKMMEEEEAELEDFPPDAPEPPVADESQDTADTPLTATPTEPTGGEEPKRKRGKRKVMKKTTKRDEKGYLVTKNEYVWESFSEDEEEEAPKVKKQIASAPPATAAPGDKKKGKAGPAGQKSLMSFFGKK